MPAGDGGFIHGDAQAHAVIGTMSLISPTSLVFPALTMVNVSYKAWLKFIMPFVIGLLVPGALFFSIGIVF